MKRFAAFLVICGAAILVATAAFHASGYEFVASEIEASSVAPFVKRAVPTIWLFFSWHLVAIASGAVGALLAVRHAAKPILIACSVVTAVDFIWVYSIAGFFVGTLLLLLGSLCFLSGGWLLPGAATRAGTLPPTT